MGVPIKPLEGRTVHQIQSGQVIIDLCSVAKELLENSLDAGASLIDIRFKNYGLESIEVQDNGSGIASDNFENIALKHYTSKLTNFDDIAALETFGFRGEALSSLCALSNLRIVTTQADQAPKGTRLEFDMSGKLSSTALTASQRGTTVVVEELFLNLPVRRRELEKNIKREYGKVLGLLQAYACISTDARIVVSNTIAKGKKVVAFATKSKSTARENIASIFGVKTLHVLAAMDLQLDMKSTENLSSRTDDRRVLVSGHVSKPNHGEGRNAPDRQMFFVNGRPCNLPQVAKVFNEVYKSHNVSQNPFIFANITLNLNAYDVNVSPDKRSIMLHDQTNLLESLRASLTTLFEEQDQRISHTQKSFDKSPAFKQSSVHPASSKDDNLSSPENEHLPRVFGGSNSHEIGAQDGDGLQISDSLDTKLQIPNDSRRETSSLSNDKQRLSPKGKPSQFVAEPSEAIASHSIIPLPAAPQTGSPNLTEKSNEVLSVQQTRGESMISPKTSTNLDHSGPKDKTESSSSRSRPSPGMFLNAFEHIRPRRQSPQTATITIGTRTRSTVLRGPIDERTMFDMQSPASSSTAEDSLENEGSIEEMSQQSQDLPASTSTAEDALPPKQMDSETEGKVRTSQETPQVGSQIGKRKRDMSQSEATQEANEKSGVLKSQSNDMCIEEQLDDEAKKAKEEAKVAELIRRAEKADVDPILDMKKRAARILRSTRDRDSTTGLIRLLNVALNRVNREAHSLHSTFSNSTSHDMSQSTLATTRGAISADDDQITLTISKNDFRDMRVIGQFNLGFILTTRNGTDLLIIDQHASDEKYNFERLQKSTTLQNQRLVQPRGLELTAFDEEIVLENDDALLKNGFQLEVDQSGLKSVGQRCQLLSLPMSKEVTFDLSDLEELIALLAECSLAEFSEHVPRPSKVRRIFAMRACRSSIMIGKTLTMSQMQGLVRHMGEIDKPWNCPHGRPTMRHICGLSDWIGWKEGTGLRGLDEKRLETVDWTSWIDDVMEVNSGEEVA